MDPELLKTTYFSVLALYPPLPRFSGTGLHEIYVEISKRHEFTSFSLLNGNGARLSTEGVRECRIQRDRVELWENIQTDFKPVKEGFGDILETVKKTLRTPVFFGFEAVLRAHWPCEETEDAIQFLNSHMLTIKPDQFQLLGLIPRGVGVRVNCPALPEKEHDFKIESLLRDRRVLFIELSSRFPSPVETVNILEQRMQEAYGFLFSQIKNFVLSFE
jgi:hypothetical protein